MADLNDLSNESFGRSCACFNLRRATRILTRRYDKELSKVGLKTTQFTVLASLLDAGAVSIGTLADWLGMERTTLTRNLRPLQKQGLVEVRVDIEDRRGRDIALTTKGRALLEAALPHWEKAQQETLGRLGPEGWEQLAAQLHRLDPEA